MNFNYVKSGALAVALSAAAMFAGEAKAATMYEGTYKATNVMTSGNAHTVWLPGLFSGTSAYWQFVPGPGKFKVGTDNATASLIGTIENNGTSNYQMAIDINYALRTPNVQGDTIKTGGGTNDGSWSFFDIASATMTGIGDLQGLVLNLLAYPDPGVEDVPFQLGEGANDKNPGLGGAGWFSWVAVTDATYTGPSPINSVQTNAGHGDININLTPVPLPAAGIMMLMGLAGFGTLRMRRKAT